MQKWLAKHMTQLMTVVGINTKPNETPIVVEKETVEGWRGTYVDTTIKLLNEQTNDDIVTT
jgi:DNA topoisomerase VI subunit B